MRKSEIKEAMKDNIVWCCNEMYAPGILPCSDIDCPFKNDEGRLAKPKELKKCRSFQITKPTDEFENSISVLVPERHVQMLPVRDQAERRQKAIDELKKHKHRARAS